MTSTSFESDFLVVGSGGGGLSAMLAAVAAGHQPLLIEKTDRLGGSTALSGGQLWLPGNHYLAEKGIADSVQRGVEYLEDVVGDVGPGTTTARKRAYVEGGLRMLDLLEREGLEFVYSPSPDDYPEAKGGTASGRAIEARLTKRSVLGEWAPLLRTDTLLPLPILMYELKDVELATRSGAHLRRSAGFAYRAVRAKATREEYMTLGAALVTQLLRTLRHRGVEPRLETAMRELLVEDGRVVGAMIDAGGRRSEIRARRGVLLASGGFGHDAARRRAEQPAPIDGSWTATAPGDTGDGIDAAVGLGAYTSNLDEAIWVPAPILDGKPILGAWERSLPHSILVDDSAQRYANESMPYMELGQKMLARHRDVPAVPSWLIIDSTHRKRYPLMTAGPRITPKKWIESGFLKRAGTIAELADQCDLDPDRLSATIDRFNGMAKVGRDEDFHRGESSYDRYFSDHTHEPNPCLGAIESPPFYALRYYVSDVATVGGIVTDEHARVLREDGSPIEGLYATGTGTASVTGRIYPAPGASIANAMIFGFVAVEHALDGIGASRPDHRPEGLR
jgi:3-oxosteroid 1-dehydrogenase